MGAESKASNDTMFVFESVPSPVFLLAPGEGGKEVGREYISKTTKGTLSLTPLRNNQTSPRITKQRRNSRSSITWGIHLLRMYT